MKSVHTKTLVCAIFTDKSKAFDYVDHDTLLNKLVWHMGFHKATSWDHCYFYST